MAAAALAPLERRPRDGLRDVDQIAQVEAGVPAGVELAMAGDAGAAGPFPQPVQLGKNRIAFKESDIRAYIASRGDRSLHPVAA